MSSYLTSREVSLEIVSWGIGFKDLTIGSLREAAQSDEKLPVALVVKAELEAVEVVFVWQVKSLGETIMCAF